MSNRNKALFVALASCALAGAALFAADIASAKPPPANAATTDSGTECLVSADFVNYELDSSCNWHIVRRRDRSGARVLLNYQDHGQLQPGQVAPASAVHTSASFPAFGLTCHGTETVTPSGEYRSSLECN